MIERFLGATGPPPQTATPDQTPVVPSRFSNQTSFNVLTAGIRGERGGQSKSATKIEAARRNGRRGGRPRADPQLTLGEHLIGRKFQPGDRARFRAALDDLLAAERQELVYFFCPTGDIESAFSGTDWKVRRRHLTKRVKYLMKKIEVIFHCRVPIPVPRVSKA